MIESFDDNDVAYARRVECEQDGLYFNRLFFKDRMGSKMIINQHHRVMQEALDRTMLPHDDPNFIPRLIINVPPGYTKTEECVINYVARGLGKFPGSRYLHLSYSDKLALVNSTTIKQIVKSPLYQNMWEVDIKPDVDSKYIWHTSDNGGVTATAAGGQVTGFRGGHMTEGVFSGAILIDDPTKPGDVDSAVKMAMVNDGYNNTVASRTALPTTPIIVVMQRVDYNDLSGFLLRGGSGEKWYHLELPVYIDNSVAYPEENTHGIPIPHGLPDGWLWPAKHNDSNSGQIKANKRVYRAQYKQRPIRVDEDNCLWVEENIELAKQNYIPFSKLHLVRTIVSIDPAVSNDVKSDEHGITCIKLYRGEERLCVSVEADFTVKGSPTKWARAATTCYDMFDADAMVGEVNNGGDLVESNLRNNGYEGRFIKVSASKGKRLRAEPVQSLYAQGLVAHAPGLESAETEMIEFDVISQLSGGLSPNRLDSIVHGITELMGSHIIGEPIDFSFYRKSR